MQSTSYEMLGWMKRKLESRLPEEISITSDKQMTPHLRKKVPEKHLFLIIDYAKAFDCVDHKKLWEILQEMGVSDHLTCLLRNLYAGQEICI